VLVLLAAALAVLVPSVYARTQAAPVNTAPPVVAVPPSVNDELSTSQGSWSNNPTSFTYQWLRCPRSGGEADGSGCTPVAPASPTPAGLTVRLPDVGDRFRSRVTATNADGTATAVSQPTLETVAPTDVNITGCPPVQQPGPLTMDEIHPPARLVIYENLSTPRTITRSTQRITLRIRVIACDGRSVRGALVYATPTPFQQFTPVERATDERGWATLTMTRMRFFPATPRQQNLVVFVRARKPGDPLLEGISSRRLVSFRVRL
jgi:hypothetical protein